LEPINIHALHVGKEHALQNLKSEIEKNEHLRLQAVITTAMLNDPIISQLDQIQSKSGFEFGPLVKAAKGQKVSHNQLKNAVIKALDILISRQNWCLV
jgi:phage antirepressor YoqD-like protein